MFFFDEKMIEKLLFKNSNSKSYKKTFLVHHETALIARNFLAAYRTLLAIELQYQQLVEDQYFVGEWLEFPYLNIKFQKLI